MVAIITNTRLCPTENAPLWNFISCRFELPGIKEKRVEEVAAVATQVVINPTPVIT